MAIYVNGKKVAGNGVTVSQSGGPGLPPGGAAGQLLSKKTAGDYDTEWIDPPEGGGSAGVASFNGRMVGARPDTWTPTAGDVGAVPAGAVASIQSLTQEEYDALAVKGTTTLYLIGE